MIQSLPSGRWALLSEMGAQFKHNGSVMSHGKYWCFSTPSLQDRSFAKKSAPIPKPAYIFHLSPI